MPEVVLRVLSGPREGAKVVVSEAAPVVVGRKRGDLLLDDPLVSGKHFQIEWRDGKLRLTDLGSTNGTMVDGRVVKDAQLKPGSEIVVGGCRMVVQVGEEAPDEPPTPLRASAAQLDIAWLLDEELVELRGSADRTRPQADVIGSDLRLPPSFGGVIEVVAGLDSGKSFRFHRGNVAIGRRQGEVPLSDVEVSRHHAVLEVFGREMIFLRDLGSTNGTYHNGRRIAMTRLSDGDTIGCGKTVMRLVLSS